MRIRPSLTVRIVRSGDSKVFNLPDTVVFQKNGLSISRKSPEKGRDIKGLKGKDIFACLRLLYHECATQSNSLISCSFIFYQFLFFQLVATVEFTREFGIFNALMGMVCL